MTWESPASTGAAACPAEEPDGRAGGRNHKPLGIYTVQSPGFKQFRVEGHGVEYFRGHITISMSWTQKNADPAVITLDSVILLDDAARTLGCHGPFIPF